MTRNFIVAPSHDWGHCLASGVALRHPALLGELFADPDAERVLWVRRVHPKRMRIQFGRSDNFARRFRGLVPGGALYRIETYAGRPVRRGWLYEHHLPYTADALVTATTRWFARTWDEVTIWVGDPKEAFLFDAFPAAWKVFDVMDDWMLLPEFAHRRARIAEGYRRAMGSNVVVCNTEMAGGRFIGPPRRLLVPNAAHPAEDPPPLPPDGVEDRPRPWFGVIGRYNDVRLDRAMLTEAVSAFPHASFFMAGRFPETVRAPLAGSPNIVWFSELSHEAALGLMARLDALFVPHRVSPYTLSQDAIKIYEAMHYGVPVVAPPIPPTDTFAAHCYRVLRPEQVGDALARALSENAERREERRRAAESYTWAARYAAYREALFP